MSWAIDDRFYRIEKWHGEDKARLAVESHAASITRSKGIVAEEGIDCDFSRLDGFLIEAEESEDDLDEELEAAHRLGFNQVEFATDTGISSFSSGRALKFPNQGQFHILKYLSGLAKSIEQNGGRLFSRTKALEWSGGDSPQVKCSGDMTINAETVVLATNYPLMSKMFAELPAYRTYVIGARVPKGSFPKVLLWDTADPYHYVRIQEEDAHDVLIVGGEDHRTGQENDLEARVRKPLGLDRERFPAAEEVLYKWSGQVFEIMTDSPLSAGTRTASLMYS